MNVKLTNLNWFLGILIFILISCQEKPKEQKPLKISNSESSEELPELDSFSEFPEEVDGCSCYFSKSKDDFKAGKYIYVNDYASLSFISVNGRLLKFELKESSDSLTKRFHIYSSPDYNLKIEIETEKETGDELRWVEGSLILKSLKTNKQKTFKFVGECGC